MSCLVLSRRHISMLGTYAVHKRLYDPPRDPRWDDMQCSDAELTAKRLYASNLRAFHTRYTTEPDTSEADIAAFRLDAPGAVLADTLPAIAVIKAARCFAYQAVDADSWATDPMKKLISDIIYRAIEDIPGYKTAVWDLE